MYKIWFIFMFQVFCAHFDVFPLSNCAEIHRVQILKKPFELRVKMLTKPSLDCSLDERGALQSLYSHTSPSLKIKLSNIISTFSLHLWLYHISTVWIWKTTTTEVTVIPYRVTVVDSRQTYRSIWGSLRSVPWSGRTWRLAPRGECAASHRGRSHKLCQPAIGTPAAAPPEDLWSQTLAGQCCCTHLYTREDRKDSKGDYCSLVAWSLWCLCLWVTWILICSILRV